MRKNAVILLIAFILVFLFSACSAGNSPAPEESTAAPVETAPDVTQSGYEERGYPKEVIDILEDSHYNHYEQNVEIEKLLEAKKAECEALKASVKAGIELYYEKAETPFVKTGGESAADIEKLEQYYADKVEFLSKKDEFCKTVLSWSYGGGNWQGTDRLIRNYIDWCDFHSELEFMLECTNYDYFMSTNE